MKKLLVAVFFMRSWWNSLLFINVCAPGDLATDDFDAASGTVMFAEGTTTDDISISVLADDVPEITEVCALNWC